MRSLRRVVKSLASRLLRSRVLPTSTLEMLPRLYRVSPSSTRTRHRRQSTSTVDVQHPPRSRRSSSPPLPATSLTRSSARSQSPRRPSLQCKLLYAIDLTASTRSTSERFTKTTMYFLKYIP
jgi:hypothetical protein